MTDVQAPREFWERKILNWETLRYSQWLALYPLSWSVRARLARAYKIILQRVPPTWSVLELGCGSGVLAAKLRNHCQTYHGIDIAQNAVARARLRAPRFSFTAADVFTIPLQSAELTLFLGLTDWVDEGKLPSLFAKLQSPQILFSYTRTSAWSWNPYRLYRLFMDKPTKAGALRARTYTETEVIDALTASGFSFEPLTRPSLLNPGVLVWARKKP